VGKSLKDEVPPMHKLTDGAYVSYRKQERHLSGCLFCIALILQIAYTIGREANMFIKKVAALFDSGELITGKNYYAVLLEAKDRGITSEYVFGFMDSHENFVDFETATKIAIEAKQVPETFSGALHPDDLLVELENDCAS
jgi:hypothetical protein